VGDFVLRSYYTMVGYRRIVYHYYPQLVVLVHMVGWWLPPLFMRTW